MFRFIYFLILIFCFYYSNTIYALESHWSGLDEAKVRIISPLSKAGDNSSIYLGLEFQLLEGWKTYWHSPGEGGYPQKLDWQKTTNVSSLEILWPQPQEFEILGIKSIGYKKEVIFPLKIELEDINRSTFFQFELNYLTCNDICLPGKAHLELLLPSGKGNLTNHSYQIEKYLSRIPFQNGNITGLKILNVTANTYIDSSFIIIEAESASPLVNPKFFLGNNVGLPIITPQFNFSTNRKNVKVKFFYDEFVLEDNSFNLSIFFSDKNIAIEHNTKILPQILSSFFIINNTYISIFLIAMLGGLILNVMPCVLPVLSLKLLSILQQNQETDFNSIRKSFFVTASGIIISFLLISFILLILRLGGTSIGWGMQFQQPIFLMFISLVLFLFSLNLLDFFEFQVPRFISNSLSIFNFNNSYYGDFFNGFFATLLATPCSAPFVGIAISTAFTQSYIIMICIFFFMGFGMSAPYILAGIFPKLVNLLPKSGPWMNKLKYFLAFLLLGTLIWLGMILQNHFNYFFIIICLCLCLIVFISFKYLKKIRNSIIFTSIVIFFTLNLFPQLKNNKVINDLDWIELNKVNINELIKENNIVFVDITADWCATCQFNKFNVIHSIKIQNLFNENKVVKVRGDWTKPNYQIEQYLNNYNRFGIPFNAIYNKDYPEGIILSELLTSSEIIKTVELMSQNK